MALLIIGCGNFDRGDDAAGLIVARRLHALGVGAFGVEIIEHSGETFSLMNSWTGYGRVILIDATAPTGTPGQVQVWSAHADRLPEDTFSCSTHTFGVREAVELARAMNYLPPILLIYGIEGKRFFLGAPPSPEVECAMASVVQQLAMAISGLLPPSEGFREWWRSQNTRLRLLKP